MTPGQVVLVKQLLVEHDSLLSRSTDAILILFV
jgi:hypothetical protein